MARPKCAVGGGVVREGSSYAFSSRGYSRGYTQPWKTGSRCCPLGPGSAWPAALPSAPAGWIQFPSGEGSWKSQVIPAIPLGWAITGRTQRRQCICQRHERWDYVRLMGMEFDRWIVAIKDIRGHRFIITLSIPLLCPLTPHSSVKSSSMPCSLWSFPCPLHL